MEIKISTGTEQDLPQLLALIKELAEFEKAPDQVINTLEKMKIDGFGERKIFDFYMIHSSDRLVGMALTYYRYSTWRGRTLYLEDLYIVPEYRGKGIGKKIMTFLAKRALESDCSRMSWEVLEWNTPAIEFYRSIDSKLDAEWINCSLEKEELEKLAG